MLTSIKIRNFKKFEEIEFELGKAVVLIGPNNSGKTAALQALTLWHVGMLVWNSKRAGKSLAKGVTINRKDLTSIQIPDTNLLWRNLDIRHVTKIQTEDGPKPDTKNIRIEISVAGINNAKHWCCGLEFDYANSESLYCRPLRLQNSHASSDEQVQRLPIPEEAAQVKVAFLPPMSGLSDKEYLKQPGEIGDLLGQGQTAQVLRNLCYSIYQSQDKSNWNELEKNIIDLFGVSLLPPKFLENAEITMEYKEHGAKLDLSSSGRGFQQTLLLLAHLYANPGTVLLMDEPDAHLEILRQQQIYQLITDVAEKNGSQLVIASHSEILLTEAAERDVVIAFVGKPHRIDGRGSQVLKSLKEIGYDQYYLAEQTGWILYLEGSTDLAILRSFADTLEHDARKILERPFVHYVLNQQNRVDEHFFGLREAKRDLIGIAIFDRLDQELIEKPGLTKIMWKRKELENYLCLEEVLIKYTKHELSDDLFGHAEAMRREQIMRDSIQELISTFRVQRKPDSYPWSSEIKATDEFLDFLFANYFEKLELPNLLRKTNYHVLANLIPKDEIDPEITEKLDLIVQVAKDAKPRED